MAKAGCLAGLIFGSVFKLIINLIKGVISIVSWCIIYLGLWAPGLYAIAGFILFATLGFNPFDWTPLGQLYFAGFVGTVVLAIIITVRNIIVKPLRSMTDGYKNPLWKRKKNAEDGDRNALPTDDAIPYQKESRKRGRKEYEGVRRTPERYGDVPVYPDARPSSTYSPYYREEPQVYQSELERGAFVHEYHDRYEVFVLKNGRMVLDKVEMKTEDEYDS